MTKEEAGRRQCFKLGWRNLSSRYRKDALYMQRMRMAGCTPHARCVSVWSVLVLTSQALLAIQVLTCCA